MNRTTTPIESNITIIEVLGFHQPWAFAEVQPQQPALEASARFCDQHSLYNDWINANIANWINNWINANLACSGICETHTGVSLSPLSSRRLCWPDVPVREAKILRRLPGGENSEVGHWDCLRTRV